MYRIDIVIPEQKKHMSNYLHYKSSLVNYFGFLRAHTSRLCLSNSPMILQNIILGCFLVKALFQCLRHMRKYRTLCMEIEMQRERLEKKENIYPLQLATLLLQQPRQTFILIMDYDILMMKITNSETTATKLSNVLLSSTCSLLCASG